MLKVISVGKGEPMSFIVNPSSQFQAGQVATLTVFGNQIVADVSNGKTILGIIDDTKTTAFTAVSWNELVEAPVINPVLNANNQWVTPTDIKVELNHAGLVKKSFTSNPVNCTVNEVHGLVLFPAGTPLNYDMYGTGIFNAIRTVVNYQYYIPNIPGDNSTAGSGRVAIWIDRCIVQTDQYETNATYPVCAPLYVSETGYFTSRKPSKYHPSVAMVTAPPSPYSPLLELLYY